ncbi:hypothetical protein [Fulvimonas soli]|uniref:Energy transducer TonB n=1 Tax=Fulvimonas soli TaxID=155197 RepID=A0A316IG01_9GAMM|nr:hypothetical protein [Fulvimonas soli]PWK92517.1 hypothetical protein C7456_102252 [Fulvimonas soli]TNY27729.1 hypothetical protein BV497_01555 [Fulvimonas soli]
MTVPASVAAPRRAPTLVLVALAATLALAALGWWGWQRWGGTPAREGDATAAAGGDQDGVAILLDLAGKAVAEKRLVAPAGSNAYEFYLSVLELDPQNAAARQALQQLFPAATAEVERSINALQLDEAARELRLLRDYDATDFTLALLGGKLDAQRQIVIREDEARAARMQAPAAAGQ